MVKKLQKVPMATIHRLDGAAQIPPIPQPNREELLDRLAVMQIHVTDIITLTNRLVTKLDSPDKEAVSLMSYVLDIVQWRLNLAQARLHYPLEDRVDLQGPAN